MGLNIYTMKSKKKTVRKTDKISSKNIMQCPWHESRTRWVYDNVNNEKAQRLNCPWSISDLEETALGKTDNHFK